MRTSLDELDVAWSRTLFLGVAACQLKQPLFLCVRIFAMLRYHNDRGKNRIL